MLSIIPLEDEFAQELIRVTTMPNCEFLCRNRADPLYATCRTGQEHLYGIRKNVVALLTSILPQLNLAGIDLETTDVDSILQQIVEVNSLKL